MTEDTPAAYVVGQTVKILNVPEYGGWATGYIESASCGVYGVRVQGLKLHTVTAQHLEPLDTPAPEDTPARLEYLRGEIRAERISYGEIIELQGLAAHIDAGDVELLQWAGVPEFPAVRTTFTLTLEVTAEDVPDGYTAEDLAADIRDMTYTAVTEETPLDAIVFTLTAAPAGAPFFKGGALESTNPRVPAPFPRDYKGWTIDARNVHGLYTATNYGAGYGQVAADTLQGIKHIITQTMAEGRRHE